MSEQKKLYKFFTRCVFPNTNFSFDTLLFEAIERSLFKSGIERDSYFQANVQRIWNYMQKMQYELQKEKGIQPLLNIQNFSTRHVSCYLNDSFKNSQNKKYYFLKSRPKILNEIDLLTSRQYEALSILLCEILSANNTLLTPSGNEAGIDFIATIKFSEAAHFLFGINGPIRIIGQCKKYNDAVQVDKVKEFHSTISDVQHLTAKIRGILPAWFYQSRGLIIGWLIGHSGFQQGAKDRAKDFGIILSDTIEIAEIISGSKKFHQDLPFDRRHEKILLEIQNILTRL